MHRPSPFALGLLGWVREGLFFLFGAWLAAPSRLGVGAWTLLIALLITYPATLQAYQDYGDWTRSGRRPAVTQAGTTSWAWPETRVSPSRDDRDPDRPGRRSCGCHRWR